MRDDYKVRGWRSTARLETALTHLTAAFRGMRVLTIDCARIRAYERERPDAGAARATVNKELSALRRAFNLGEEAGLVQKKPRIHTPDPRNRRVGFITPEDFTALLAALPDELKPPVEFAYLTAWRKSEVLGLTWDRVDFTAQTVRLDTSKSDEPRLFPFGLLPQLAALLKTQRDRTKTLERATGQIIPWVFHRDGKPIKSYDGAWHAACDRAAHEERNRRAPRRAAPAARPRPPRSPTLRGAQPAPGRGGRGHDHETLRLEYALDVRPLRHHRRARP